MQIKPAKRPYIDGVAGETEVEAVKGNLGGIYSTTGKIWNLVY